MRPFKHSLFLVVCCTLLLPHTVEGQVLTESRSGIYPAALKLTDASRRDSALLCGAQSAVEECREKRLAQGLVGAVIGAIVGYNIARLPDGGTDSRKHKGVLIGALAGFLFGLVVECRD